MNENQNVDIDREQNNGQITYANEVISTIVSVATTEVDGISAIAGNNGLLGKGKLPRGVRVDMNGEDVSVDVSVTVDYGMPIQKVGRSAQENVRKSIESMTGLHVEKVDLHVVGVSFEKENEELSAKLSAHEGEKDFVASAIVSAEKEAAKILADAASECEKMKSDTLASLKAERDNVTNLRMSLYQAMQSYKDKLDTISATDGQ